MRQPQFYNREKNNDLAKTLAGTFANRKTVINNSAPNFGLNTPIYSQSSQNENSNQAGQLINSAASLAKNLYGAWKNKGTTGDITGNSANPMPNESIIPLGQSELGNSSIGGLFSNIAPYGGIISGGLNAGKTALEGGDWKDDVPQSFFGINPDGSDVNQSVSGALKGAQMGAPLGPIGMAVGAALGLGSSFLDDI